MKRTFLAAILIAIVSSCSSEPEVTNEMTSSSYYDIGRLTGENVSFRGRDNYVVFDANKICRYNHNNCFRTEKPYAGAKILKDDICISCGYSWNKHNDR